MNIYFIFAIMFFILTAVCLACIFSLDDDLIPTRALRIIHTLCFIAEPICGIAFLVFGGLGFVNLF